MAEKATPDGAQPVEGDRIAKVLSRRGVASRREAERLIEAGEVRVNGKIIESPALNVTDRDLITISGHPLPALEPARLWLYYKPDGLVTSANDEKGRDTVFDHLPDDLPRVMSVGRLDLNSEGLLLLTNDGALKRRLELPSTGWLRKYRVRVNGNPTDPDLEPLRRGIEIDGEKFQPMAVVLDRHQGANAWLTVGLREGKNREVRRAMAAINLTVNRLIRVSYGPFRLGELKPGEVEEVRAKTLREQLGEGGGQDAPDAIARKPRGPASATRTPRAGDGVRALAKAWDDATAPRKTAERPAKPGVPRHAERDSDAAPRRAASAKPTFGAKSRDEARAPRSSAEDRRPASKSAADRPTRRVTTTSRAEGDTAPRRAASAKPAFGAKSRDTAPTPRSNAEDRRPASKFAVDRPTRRVSTTSRAEGDTAPTPRRIAGPKSGVPKRAASPSRVEGDSATPSRRIAGPKPGYVKSGAKPTTKPPSKPPSKPRKG